MPPFTATQNQLLTEHLRNFVFDHFTSREEVVHLETSLVFEHKFSRSLPCFPQP